MTEGYRWSPRYAENTSSREPKFALTDDDVLDNVTAVNAGGDELPLTEALGMMRLAEDTLIRAHMDGGE